MTFIPQTRPIHNLSSFRFGLNTQQSPDEIHDYEMADCENVSVEEDSVLSAPGYSTWDDNIANNVGPYYGGVMFDMSDGTVVNVRQRLGQLEYAADADVTWVACTLPTSGSPATTVTLTQIPCTFAKLNDTLIWSNGTDTVMSSTDGITWTLRAGLPKSKVVFNNGKNRVLFLAQPANPYRFDWSDINDGLTINAAAFQLIDPNSNGKIIGAGKTPAGTTLIFKESALYSIADFVDDGIIDINFIGTTTIMSHNSIATTEDSVIWLSYDGFFELIGGQINIISGRLNWVGRNQIYGDDSICSGYYDGRYHCAMPDADISTEYNSQEYIIYKRVRRDDVVQPYVITRNRRYIGMYFIEDFEFSYGFDHTMYIGDSRSEDLLTSSGSPAVREDPIFAWTNPWRATEDPNFEIEKGLAGASQACYFTTKYFTENAAFHVKRIRKAFANFKVTQDFEVTISYRFLPYGEWTEVNSSLTANEIDWIYDDETEGGFSEGYGFADDTLGNIFIDIENSEKPRGIQFKLNWDEINDVRLYGMAYNYKLKPKFK